MTIRVAATAIGNRIYAGRPNKKGDAFLAGRTDVTGDVLKAISEFVGIGHEVTVTCDGEPSFKIAVTPAVGDIRDAHKDSRP